MNTSKYISLIVLAAVLALSSCSKMEPLNEKNNKVECGVATPEASAIMIDPNGGSEDGEGITDPDHDEEHDRDDVSKLNIN